MEHNNAPKEEQFDIEKGKFYKDVSVPSSYVKVLEITERSVAFRYYPSGTERMITHLMFHRWYRPIELESELDKMMVNFQWKKLKVANNLDLKTRRVLELTENVLRYREHFEEHRLEVIMSDRGKVKQIDKTCLYLKYSARKHVFYLSKTPSQDALINVLFKNEKLAEHFTSILNDMQFTI